MERKNTSEKLETTKTLKILPETPIFKWDTKKCLSSQRGPDHLIKKSKYWCNIAASDLRNFLRLRNVDGRILRIENCERERIGRERMLTWDVAYALRHGSHGDPEGEGDPHEVGLVPANARAAADEDEHHGADQLGDQGLDQAHPVLEVVKAEVGESNHGESKVVFGEETEREKGYLRVLEETICNFTNSVLFRNFPGPGTVKFLIGRL